MSTAAGLATLQYVEDNDLQGNAKAMGERFANVMMPIADATPWIAELRGRGLMWAFEICHPGSTEPDAARTAKVLEACKDHGLLVGKGGLYGNVIRLTPMLDITPEEMDRGTDALRSAFADAS